MPSENAFELLKVFVRNNAAYLFGLKENSKANERLTLIPFHVWNKSFPRSR
jgi:hypothetical protein